MEPPMEFDIESDWEPLRHDWDLIHARTPFGSTQRWDSLYKKIYESGISTLNILIHELTNIFFTGILNRTQGIWSM